MKVKVNLPTELVNRVLASTPAGESRNSAFSNLIQLGHKVSQEVLGGSKLLLEKHSGKLTQVVIRNT